MPTSEKLTFTGAGGEALDGRLDVPSGNPRAVALFAHCFTCGKDIAAASRISRALTERGIAVLRFDFTGLGGSDGEFANSTFSSNVSDLVRAADHLRATIAAPSLLVGHSLGGGAGLGAAPPGPGVRAGATTGRKSSGSGEGGRATNALVTGDYPTVRPGETFSAGFTIAVTPRARRP